MMYDFLLLFWDFFFYPLRQFDIENPLFTVLYMCLIAVAVYRVIKEVFRFCM